MKSQTNNIKKGIKGKKIALMLMLCCCCSTASFAGVQVDPALTSAITLQMNTLKNIYSKREKTQKQIIEAEAAVTLALDRMHKVESKMLDYMSNVQGAFQNLYQIKLLNSAERYYICNTVVDKLENINTSLYLLSWEIQTMRWRDLFFKLDPEGWAAVMSGKNIVESIVSDWNYNLRRYN